MLLNSNCVAALCWWTVKLPVLMLRVLWLLGALGCCNRVGTEVVTVHPDSVCKLHLEGPNHSQLAKRFLVYTYLASRLFLTAFCKKVCRCCLRLLSEADCGMNLIRSWSPGALRVQYLLMTCNAHGGHCLIMTYRPIASSLIC